jgi:hypothetical protein
MWIFTTHGFFSAVCARKVRGHLEALQRRFPDLGQSEIVESHDTDYAYRIFVDKSAWSKVLSELAEETDYDNFKAAVAHQQGNGGGAYERSLHRVWAVMYELQMQRER